MVLSELKASPGEVVEVGRLEAELTQAQVVALIKTNDLEVFHVVVPRGCSLPTHEFSREVIVHCLQGYVTLVSPRQGHDLKAGQLLYYATDEPFSILGLEDASLLVMAALNKTGEATELIG